MHMSVQVCSVIRRTWCAANNVSYFDCLFVYVMNLMMFFSFNNLRLLLSTASVQWFTLLFFLFFFSFWYKTMGFFFTALTYSANMLTKISTLPGKGVGLHFCIAKQTIEPKKSSFMIRLSVLFFLFFSVPFCLLF